MNASQMIELMNRQPFSPLGIHLNDGSSILVEHPYNISTARNSPSCVVHDEEKEKMHFVAYRNISEIITDRTSANGE